MPRSVITARVGKVGIDFRPISPKAIESCLLAKDMIILPLDNSCVEANLKVIAIAPDFSDSDGELMEPVPEDMRGVVKLLGDTWAKTAVYSREETSYREKKAKDSASLLGQWRKLSGEIEPVICQSALYRWKRGREEYFICFLSDLPEQNARRIISITQLLGEYWHDQRGGLALVHAAAVIKAGRGYMFLGPSGAGKSTAAILSLENGSEVIDDDMSCIAADDDGHYRVLSTGCWVRLARERKLAKLPPLAEVGLGIPLAGIFVLAKDQRDYLVPLSERSAAYMLTRQALWLDNNIPPKMPEAMMRRIFDNCCTIAGQVPAYELHFRKSPDFWKVIDAELGG
jgi:SynChlorMet cassette protein ScmC